MTMMQPSMRPLPGSLAWAGDEIAKILRREREQRRREVDRHMSEQDRSRYRIEDLDKEDHEDPTSNSMWGRGGMLDPLTWRQPANPVSSMQSHGAYGAPAMQPGQYPSQNPHGYALGPYSWMGPASTSTQHRLALVGTSALGYQTPGPIDSRMQAARYAPAPTWLGTNDTTPSAPGIADAVPAGVDPKEARESGSPIGRFSGSGTNLQRPHAEVFDYYEFVRKTPRALQGMDRKTPQAIGQALGERRAHERKLRDALIAHLPAVEAHMRSYVKEARLKGRNQSADNLERYLDGVGGFKYYDPRWFRSQEEVRSAESRIQDHFANWLSGTLDPKNPAEFVKSGLIQLKDGQTLRRSSTWDGDENKDFWDPYSQPVRSDEFSDLYNAIGQSNIKGNGDFEFKKRGSRIEFEGIVSNVWQDRYDWNKGDTVPFIGLHHEVPMALEQFAKAKSFDMYSAWRTKATGTLVVREDRSGNRWLELDSIHWSDVPPVRRNP